MEHTLDDVIDLATSPYEFAVPRGGNDSFLGFYRVFLERRQALRPYDLGVDAAPPGKRPVFVYRDQRVDELILFSVMGGFKPVIPGRGEDGILVASVGDLAALRKSSSSSSSWDDTYLFSLWNRLKMRSKNYGLNGKPAEEVRPGIFSVEDDARFKVRGLVRYKEAFDEIGRDPFIVEHLGRPVSYEDTK